MADLQTDKDLVKELDKLAPAAAHASLGTTIDGLQTAFNALLTKLDADAGVTDTTYSSLLKVTPISQR